MATSLPPLRYAELAARIEGWIREGMFRPGEKLPSVRALKASTHLSTTTVCRALEEVERRGLAVARPRSGYVVASPASALSTPSVVYERPQVRRVTLRSRVETFVEATGRRDLVPLGGTALSPDLVPMRHLARIARDVLRTYPDAVARYDDPAGTPDLRREIARLMVRFPNAPGADEVVVTQGCLDAVRLCLLAVAQAGDVVAVESPTYFGFLLLVRDLRMRVVEIPVDPESGIDLDILEATLDRLPVRALLVAPTFQNPLGAVMSDERKGRLARLAHDREMPVIESDVYGDLPHSGERPAPLAAFDRSGWVLYCSSISKTLSPGLRVGWTAPGRYLSRVRSLKLSGSVCSPLLNELIVSEFLASGSYFRHVRQLTQSLRTQLAAVSRAIERDFPEGTRLTSPAGGYVLWAQLHAAVDSVRLYDAALGAGVSIMPGAFCSVGHGYANCIRISSGHPWSDRIEAGIRTLGRLVEQQLARSPTNGTID